MIVSTAWLLLELVGLFFGVALAIHLFQRRLGSERLRAWMGGSPVTSALKGIAVGFITPFCTYSAIPMLVGLRQANVPPAGYVAFISAAPVLDPVLFGALVLIVGIEAAVIYTAVAFTAAMTLAVTAQRVGIERHLKPLPASLTAQVAVGQPVGASASLGSIESVVPGTSGVSGSSGPSAEPAACGADTTQPWQGIVLELPAAVRAAAGLLRSVAALLIVGVAVGLLIEAAVSPETVASITGDNGIWSIPVAAALGTPLYFQTSLFVPIANALTNAGVGIGAIVALTISGAGANVPEFIILTKLASRRLIGIFFAYVFAVALTGGLIAQALLG